MGETKKLLKSKKNSENRVFGALNTEANSVTDLKLSASRRT